MQTKTQSGLEACMNTGSGFVVSYVAGIFVYPAFGWHISPGENAAVVAIYTVISVVRSYVWRRIFNHLHAKPKEFLK